MGAAFFQAAQGFGNALKDHAALAGADGLTKSGARPALTQLGLDAVKMPDLKQDKSGVLRGVGLGFKKLAAHMRPAGGQADVLPGGGKGGIGRVAIALDDTGKGGGNNVSKARRCPAGLPVEKGVAARSLAGP